jgi:hypothetical protein
MKKDKGMATHKHKPVNTKQDGLPQDIKNVIDAYFPNGTKREKQQLQKLFLIKYLKVILLAAPERKYIATENDE